jgi:hypothetical protein
MMVAVRPADEQKTYLGMYLCSAPTGVVGRLEGDQVILMMTDYCNPAIYVPKLDQIVWGYESWWKKIEDEGQLREITDNDVNSIWYIRALKQLLEEKKPDNS